MGAPLVGKLLALWEEPLADRVDAEADFREVYADPTVINGSPVPVSALVAQAAAVQAALPGRRSEILDVVEVAGRLVVAFVIHARQTGPLPTQLGVVRPTGREVAIRTIDVITVVDGRIAGIWVVADELGALRQLDAVALSG